MAAPATHVAPPPPPVPEFNYAEKNSFPAAAESFRVDSRVRSTRGTSPYASTQRQAQWKTQDIAAVQAITRDGRMRGFAAYFLKTKSQVPVSEPTPDMLSLMVASNFDDKDQVDTVSHEFTDLVLAIQRLDEADTGRLLAHYGITFGTGNAKAYMRDHLPRIPPSIQYIEYTHSDNDNVHAVPVGTSNSYFKNLFTSTLVNTALAVTPSGKQTLDTKIHGFTQSGRLFGMKLNYLAEHPSQAHGAHGLVSADGEAAIEAEIDMLQPTVKGMWTRDVNGQLHQTTTVNDKKVKNPMTPVVKLTAKECFSTGAAGSEDQCQEYAFECLLRGDDESMKTCNAFLQEGSFFNGFTDKLKKMHPVVVKQTLSRFGFRSTMEYDDEAGMQLKKVESVSSWLSNLKASGKYDQGSVNLIKGNVPLKKYLQGLVVLVNSNPALLNKNYTGNSEEKMGTPKLSPFAKQHGFRPFVSRESSSGLLSSLMARLTRNSIASTLPRGADPLSFIKNWQAGLARSAGVVGQRGGAAPKISGAQILLDVFQKTLNRLERGGIKIQSSDVKKIVGKIEQYGQLESEVIKSINTIQKYNQQSLELGRGQENKTVSESELQKLVNRQETVIRKFGSTEEGLMQVMKSLLTAENGGDASDLVQISASDARE